MYAKRHIGQLRRLGRVRERARGRRGTPEEPEGLLAPSHRNDDI